MSAPSDAPTALRFHNYLGPSDDDSSDDSDDGFPFCGPIHHDGISFPRTEHASVKVSIAQQSQQPTTHLGALAVLPLELLGEICLDLDLPTIFKFRQVNRMARAAINSLPQYRITATDALDCFCAALRTRAASSVTLREFFEIVCDGKCANCKHFFGNLIDLPSWERCCSMCLSFLDRYGPPSRTYSERRIFKVPVVSEVLQMPPPSLQSIPSLKGIKNTYLMGTRMTVDLGPFISKESVMRIVRELRPDIMPQQLERDLAKCFTDCAFVCCMAPFHDLKTGKTITRSPCNECNFGDSANETWSSSKRVIGGQPA